MILVLFSLKIEFLSMVFLIIYIGAISILFLFVIMLFNLKKIYDFKRLQIYHITSMIIALCFFFKFYYIVTNSFQIHFNSDLNTQVSEFIYLKSVAESLIYFEDIVAIGANLYTATSELFLAVGYVLLVAMVGAIILALSTVKQPKIIFVK
jgi:NADH:ubiquinone oxidoreductase subunit 6 (subunit J)